MPYLQPGDLVRYYDGQLWFEARLVYLSHMPLVGSGLPYPDYHWLARVTDLGNYFDVHPERLSSTGTILVTGDHLTPLRAPGRARLPGRTVVTSIATLLGLSALGIVSSDPKSLLLGVLVLVVVGVIVTGRIRRH
jgi:hypothetical protein